MDRFIDMYDPEPARDMDKRVYPEADVYSPLPFDRNIGKCDPENERYQGWLRTYADAEYLHQLMSNHKDWCPLLRSTAGHPRICLCGGHHRLRNYSNVPSHAIHRAGIHAWVSFEPPHVCRIYDVPRGYTVYSSSFTDDTGDTWAWTYSYLNGRLDNFVVTYRSGPHETDWYYYHAADPQIVSMYRNWNEEDLPF